MTRVRDYARLMASLGINGCSINNVNADVRVITPEYLPEVARIAEAFRPWGVRMYISLELRQPARNRRHRDVRSARSAGRRVLEGNGRRRLRAIPDLGGFVLKADSEGRLGPSEYGRTPADAANVIARALKPHGGVLFYRGFVYNHKMDWRDLKNDRATAAYNNFHKLDGLFEDNVVIQIKHGPIDFQVREPASPLFGGLEKTNQAIELQITQEYLGQQRHLCYIVPMWKEVLDFDMHASGARHAGEAACRGQDVRAAARAGSSACRTSAATRTGSAIIWRWRTSTASAGWRGIPICRASRSPRSGRGRHSATIRWSSTRSSTCCCARGRSTKATPARSASARSPTSFTSTSARRRSRRNTTAGGSGIGPTRPASAWIARWRPAPASSASIGRPSPRVFESLETCPDELLLFMHHVPYTHRLRTGKTVIQHFYDAHYEGAEEAAAIGRAMAHGSKARIDEQRYREVLDRLEYQAGHAQVWRDAICRWFMKRSRHRRRKGPRGQLSESR